MGNLMEWECIFGQTETIMKDSGKIIADMVWEFIMRLRVKDTKEIGNRTKRMGKGLSTYQRAIGKR